MNPSGLVNYRIEDMTRQAEAARMAKRARRTTDRRAATRKPMSAVLALLTWPIRH